MPDTSNLLTPEELVEITATLQDVWSDFFSRPGNTEFKRPAAARTVSAVYAIHGLCANTAQFAAGVLTIYRHCDDHMVMTPITRSAFESGLTAHWLSQISGAAEAWTNEYVRQSEAIAKSLEAARSSVYKTGADQFRQNRTIPTVSSESNAQARNFAQMCEDLELASGDAYVIYRLICELSHPGVTAADQYFEEVQGEVVMRPTSTLELTDFMLYLTACSLVWAMKAVDFTTHDKSMRGAIHAAAGKLGISEVLKPSQAALTRTN